MPRSHKSFCETKRREYEPRTVKCVFDWICSVVSSLVGNILCVHKQTQCQGQSTQICIFLLHLFVPSIPLQICIIFFWAYSSGISWASKQSSELAYIDTRTISGICETISIWSRQCFAIGHSNNNNNVNRFPNPIRISRQQNRSLSYFNLL